MQAIVDSVQTADGEDIMLPLEGEEDRAREWASVLGMGSGEWQTLVSLQCLSRATCSWEIY